MIPLLVSTGSFFSFACLLALLDSVVFLDENTVLENVLAFFFTVGVEMRFSCDELLSVVVGYVDNDSDVVRLSAATISECGFIISRILFDFHCVHIKL